jgi:hypothetical protein
MERTVFEESLYKATTLLDEVASQPDEHEWFAGILTTAYPNVSERSEALAIIAANESFRKLASVLLAFQHDDLMDSVVAGINEDLYYAVLTAYRRGATEWAELNYPQWMNRIKADIKAQDERKGKESGNAD